MMANIRVLGVVLCFLTFTGVRCMMRPRFQSFHHRGHRLGLGVDYDHGDYDHLEYLDRITRISNDDDDDDDDDDDVDEYEDPCTVKNRLELIDIKKELQSLTSLVDNLREKVDPDFKMPVKAEEPQSRCPDGFEYAEQARSCYKVIYKRSNWDSAVEQCKALNSDSHLISIASSEENDALTKYLTKVFSKSSARLKCVRHQWGNGETALWTSGQRVNETNCNSNFVWKIKTDESNPLNFTNWFRGEPNCFTTDENCLQIIPKHRSTWNDVSCNIPTCPICEYDPHKV